MNFDNIEDFGFDLKSFRDWCEYQSNMKSMPSSKIAFGRTHKWFGNEVILVHPTEIRRRHYCQNM